MLEFRPNLLPLQTNVINNHQIFTIWVFLSIIYRHATGASKQNIYNWLIIKSWGLRIYCLLCWPVWARRGHHLLAVIMVVIKYNLGRQRLNYLCIGLSFPPPGPPSWTLDSEHANKVSGGSVLALSWLSSCLGHSVTLDLSLLWERDKTIISKKNIELQFFPSI